MSPSLVVGHFGVTVPNFHLHGNIGLSSGVPRPPTQVCAVPRCSWVVRGHCYSCGLAFCYCLQAA